MLPIILSHLTTTFSMTNFTKLAPRLGYYFSAVLLSPLFFACADQSVEPAANISKNSAAEIVSDISTTNPVGTDSIGTIKRTLAYQINALTVGGNGAGTVPFTGQLRVVAEFDQQGNFISARGLSVRLTSTAIPSLDNQTGRASRFFFAEGDKRLSATFRFSTNHWTVAFKGRGSLATGYTGSFVTSSAGLFNPPSGRVTLTPIQ